MGQPQDDGSGDGGGYGGDVLDLADLKKEKTAMKQTPSRPLPAASQAAPFVLVLVFMAALGIAGYRPSEAAQAAAPVGGLGPTEIMSELSKASTGNVSDAVDEATGQRGFMFHDMKPAFRSQLTRKVVGRAATALLRPVLKNDARAYENAALQVLDEAAPGSVLVYVLENGLEIAGLGNLMATTAKVRGLAGVVIDGGVRDVDEVEEIGLPVWSRTITPATSVGRYVSVSKQQPVNCGGVQVRPGDYVVADWTGVVVVPQEKIAEVVRLLRQYDEKESRMVPIIKETKSMLKALAIYGRY